MRKVKIPVPWGNLSVVNSGEPFENGNNRLLLLNGVLKGASSFYLFSCICKNSKKAQEESGTRSWDSLASALLKQKGDLSIVGFDFPGFGASSLPNYYFTLGNIHGFSIYE